TTEYLPDAITLDIRLPDLDGWRILSRLKNDFRTRHIPVFVISTEEDRQRGLRLVAAGVMVKPIATREQLVGMLESVKAYLHRPRRRLLLLEPDAARYGEMVDLVACGGVETVRLECEREAVEALRRGDGDCL